MTVRLPPSSSGSATQELELETPTRLVLIGANGSGKTRLGIWLEENNQAHMPVHRISAQKALTLPDYATVKNLGQAEKDLYFGRSDQHASNNRKVHDRWGGHPATHLLSDYEMLLSLLFARDADRNREHTEHARATGQYVPVPKSPIDEVVELWAYLMPQRTISFNDGQVIVGRGTAAEYHAKEMSDGERVTLYLLGQCLTAAPGAMLIIDEPEMHLHRSLMDKLWNKVEELCPDKSFVYITHDLDFASGRAGARKIWVQSFVEGVWNWLDVPSDDALPESLVLEIIGNRKPLLFCEGERGGLDHSLYQLAYPDHHVVPRGNSEKVIEAVKALRANETLHTLSVHGLIDRDVRTEHEVRALESHGIEVLKHAEVENLLCAPVFLQSVARTLQLNVDQVVREATAMILDSLRSELEAQVTMRAARRIRYHLSCYTPARNDRDGLHVGLQDLISTLDIGAIASDAEVAFADVLSSGDLNAVLAVYNRKSIADRISSCFRLSQGEYPALVLRLLKGPDSHSQLALLRDQLPRL